MITATEPSLLQRAERALGGAAAALFLLPLPVQADALTTADLIVQGSGAYFYNASGYFADWRGQPDGAAVSELNPDGSAKFYGTASASPQQFLAHNCNQEYGCSWYQDRGIALAWWGTLKTPAQAGDQLELRYDLGITMPDLGGTWSLGAYVSAWDPYNSVPDRMIDELRLDAGTHQLSGTVFSRPVEDWQVGPGSGPVIYWQVVLAATADAPWSERSWSDF